MMRVINWILLIVLVVWFALLGIFNSAKVQFDYVFASGEWPLVAVMTVCFLFGALLTLLLFGVKSLYWKAQARALQKQLIDEHRQAQELAVQTQFEQVQKS